MPNTLRIILIVFALVLLLITLNCVSKNKMPIRYSLIWIVSSIILVVVGIFPNFSNLITKIVGFQTTSNLVIGIMLALLLIVTMMLTVIVSGQKKKIKLLTQELSIVKAKQNER